MLTQGLKLVKAYRRGQGFIFREDDPRFEDFQDSFQERFKEMLSDPELRMINRNRGSGTRVLIDGLLGKHQPQGFLYEAKSHQAVAAAVAYKGRLGSGDPFRGRRSGIGVHSFAG